MLRTDMHTSEATALTWAVLGAAICTWVIPLEPSLLEEGLILHIAQRMVAGEHLYRDIASFTGPFPFEMLAALFRVFGEEVAVARAPVVLLQGLACASVYAIAWRAGAGPFAHAAAAVVASAPVLLFPLFSLFFHTTLAFQLTLIAAWPAERATRSLGWALVAGAVVAAAALCKQTIGVVLAAGLLAVVATGAAPGRRVRTALSFAAGGAAVAALTLGFYAARGDLAVLVQSLVVLPLSFDETFSSPYMNFWPPGQFSAEVGPQRALYLPSLYTLRVGVFTETGTSLILLTQFLYALPFLALAATGLRRVREALSTAAWVHTAVLVALITNLFPRADWGHLVFVLPSALAQILLLAPRMRPETRPRRAQVAGAVVLLLALAIGSAFGGRMIFGLSKDTGLGPRVPQRPVTSRMRGRAVTNAVGYLRLHLQPGESIFVARAEPLLYFATETRNPTPYSGVIPGIRDEQQSTILAALDDVRYVVMSDIDQPLFTYYREELPRVQAHLERHFRIPRNYPMSKYNWLSVLEPGPDRGPTFLDLFDAGERRRGWIWDIDGVERPAPELPPKLATKMNRRPLAVWLGPYGGGVDFEVEIPEGAVFQAGIGVVALVGAQDLFLQAEKSRFEVAISRGDEFETVGWVFLIAGGLRWMPFEVDLSAYAGERATLRLALRSETLLDPGLVAFWGSPRIALPPPAAGAGETGKAVERR